MLNDILSNALTTILNAERVGKKECTINTTSKVVERVLEILNEKGYIGKFEKNEKMMIHLIGKINKCGSIKPRMAIKNDQIEKFETRYLPSKAFGVLIISTPQGIITNTEARKKRIGGKLIGYCY